jgi:creatinine amidohydrolase
MRILAHMTSEEIRQILKKEKNPVTIVVVGSVEAHGSHLPLGTDIIQPEEVAMRVSEKTGAIVAPAIPYGVCSSTRGFPGTVTVSMEAMYAYTKSVLEGFVNAGFKRLIILTGHAGSIHMASLRAAAQDVVDGRPDVRCAVLSDYDYAYEFIEKDPELKDDGHAGNIETSRIMAMKPELVRKDVTPGSDYPSHIYILPRPEEAWTGTKGDATKASRDRGKMINAYIVKKLCDLVTEMKR